MLNWFMSTSNNVHGDEEGPWEHKYAVKTYT